MRILSQTNTNRITAFAKAREGRSAFSGNPGKLGGSYAPTIYCPCYRLGFPGTLATRKSQESIITFPAMTLAGLIVMLELFVIAATTVPNNKDESPFKKPEQPSTKPPKSPKRPKKEKAAEKESKEVAKPVGGAS